MKPVKRPEDCKNIGEIRDAIDVIDRQIVKLFGERHEYVKKIVKFKSGEEEAIIARERKEHVLKQRRAWAEESGLDPVMMEDVFKLLIEKNIQLQFELKKNKEN